MNYTLEEHKEKKKITKGQENESVINESAQVLAKINPDTIKDLNESAEGKKKRRLVVKMEAIHVGRTSNYTYYTEEGLKNGLSSWTSPYNKPVLTHHNQFEGEPIGRILDADFSETNISGKSGLVFTVEITDPEAIEKVLDGRYQTVSIGASTDKVTCNICGTDRTEDWCEHWKGDTYDGQECHYIIGTTYGKEVSYVNTPSDQHAGNVSVSVDNGDPKEGAQSESFAKILQVAEGLVQDIESPDVNLYESSDKLRGMIDDLVKEGRDTNVDPKKDDVTVSVEEHDTLKESYKTIEKERDDLQEQVKSLQSDLSEAQGTVTKMYVKNERLDSKVNEMASENDTLTSENTKLRESVHRAKVEKVVEMKMHLRKSDVIGVSLEEAVESHASKSKEYLEDLEKDLIAEMKDSKGIRGQVADPTSKGDPEDDQKETYTVRDAEAIISTMFGNKK